MKNGDISNQMAPAIVINADVIMEYKKKFFGLRYQLNFLLSSRHLLELWFERDIAVYILLTDEYTEAKRAVEDLLDTFMVPHTRVIVVKTAPELEFLLSANHIMGYFYKERTLVDIRSNKSKHHQVENIVDISNWLGGNKI